jgi:type II secretory pathway pseudopilin PulG
MYEGDDLNYEDEETPPEESSNRTFLIAAGILGGIILLTLCLLGGYALITFQNQNAAQQDEDSAQATQNAQINEALTATGVAFDLSQTPQATETLFPTDTPVVAQPTATDTPEFTLTPDPATATVAAGLTQLAASTTTVIATTTALPTSGFADEVGLPGLVIAAMVLVAVIFLARRLRAAPTQ